jgi:MFS transporter, YNFM family, putative membrane transport protein
MVFHGALRGDRPRDVIRRSTIIAIISFLTLIDLFGAQALLPQIIVAFKSNAATAGVAVNAATFGMAVSGLTVAWFADRIDRKRGIWICLALLSIPTALLCLTDDIWVFMALRVIQGTLMAAAFTLTMTFLSEQCEIMAVGGALAAYITGNVASNLFGRLAAVTMAGATGLSGTFLFFAALNIAGAVFAYVMIGPRDSSPPKRGGSPLAAWRRHFAVPPLRATFGIGFLILFIFAGVFTYVNLYLVKDIGLAPMSLGFVYLIFAPAIITTPLAANQVKKYGPKRALLVSLATVLGGITLTLSGSVWIILFGLSIIGMAIFFAQAAATGYLSKSVTADRAQANGLYLTSYYFGGLMGAIILGQINMIYGWSGTVTAVGLAVFVAMTLAMYVEA